MNNNTSLHKTTEEFVQKAQQLLSQRRPDALLEIFTSTFTRQSWEELPPQLIFSIGDIALQTQSWQLAADTLSVLHKNDQISPNLVIPLSEALRQLGMLKDAEKALKTAWEAYPQDPSLATNLANITSELGNYQQAEQLYRQVANNRPNEFLGHYNLAGFLAMLGRNEEASLCYKTCLQIVPNAPEAINGLKQLEDTKGDYLQDIFKAIENSEWDSATEKLKANKDKIDPVRWHSAVLELPAIHQDQISEAHFYDPTVQVQCKELFKADNSLLNELKLYIKQEPSLIWNRAGKPTRSGSQTHEILAGRGRSSCIDRLTDCLTKTLESFNRQSIESLTGAWSEPLKLSGWAVVLSEGGHQKRHIHPEARMSGVFYVQVPEPSEQPTSEDCGDLCFGSAQNEEPLLRITPKPGMAIFFPSYFPHYTIPLKSNTERICIAFNVK